MALITTSWQIINSYLNITAHASTPADAVYAQVLDWKGIVGARQQQLRRLHQQLRESGNQEVAKIEAQLQDATRSLATISQGKANGNSELRFREQEFSDKIEQLQQQLAKASAEYREQMQRKNVTVDDVRGALPKGVALVDFLGYKRFVPPKTEGVTGADQPMLVAFIVRPNETVVRVELGPTEPIERAIKQWRTSYGRKQDDADPGAVLRQLVWQPLQKYIPSTTETVLISPNGLMAPVAWAALPGDKPGEFLIDEVSIAVVPIPSLLPAMLGGNESTTENATVKTPARSASLLLVGDVDFGADPGRSNTPAIDQVAARGGDEFNWPSLPGTREEVASIQASFVKQFPNIQPTVLAQGKATKNAVSGAMSQCEYIHLSTHGFFCPREHRGRDGVGR